MRIEHAEVIRYALPFARPYTTSRGTLDSRELVMLEIQAEGLTARGEAAAMTLRGAESAGRLAAELEEAVDDLLVGSEIEDPVRAMIPFRNRDLRAELLACIDISLHDLVAQSQNVPLWRFLGADAAGPVTCNATLPLANPTEISQIAQRWSEEGFDTFKLKVGVPGDSAQLAAVRERIGSEGRIRLDANGVWTPGEAIDRITALGLVGDLELVEEPTSSLDALAEVRRAVDVRIAADESVTRERDASMALELDACDIVTVKLAKVGGISGAVAIGGRIPTYMSSALEGPVGISAAAHTVQAIPDAGVAHGLATERLFSESIGAPGRWEGSDLLLSDSPGLGVDLDEEKLKSLRLA